MRHENPFRVEVRRPVVFGTGLIALDVVINHDHTKQPRLWAGGTCGNVLAVLSYQGWLAFPVGRLNGDTASTIVQRDLRRWGVRLKFASLAPSSKTPVVVHRILKRAGSEPIHRFFWKCPSCGSYLPSYRAVVTSAAKRVVAKLSKPKVVFVDRTSRGAILLAKAGAEHGAMVFFEPSAAGEPSHFRELFRHAHVLKYSGEMGAKLQGLVPTLGPLLEIETLGAEGLRYRSRIPGCTTSGWQRIGAFRTGHIMDMAGAGDWCTAGIIHRLGQKGLSGLLDATAGQLRDALRFGQALAAWNCQFEGARGGMYSVHKGTFRSQVMRILGGEKCWIPEARPVRIARSLRRAPICSNCGYMSSLRRTFSSPAWVHDRKSGRICEG